MPLSKLEALKIDEWNRMIDVNLRGVLHGIAAVLPVMQRQRIGQVVNVASIGAYTVSPTVAVYCATKFAVAAITEGLRQEVGGDIRITLVSPGVVESELAVFEPLFNLGKHVVAGQRNLYQNLRPVGLSLPGCRLGRQDRRLPAPENVVL